SQTDDSHELPLSQLPAHGAEDASTPRLAVGTQHDGRVLVEADVGAIQTTALLAGSHDHGLDDIASLDVAPRDRVLDRGDDHIADAGMPTTRSAEDPDAKDLLGTGVVGDFQSRFLLDHSVVLSLLGLPVNSALLPLTTSPSRGSPPHASAWSR